MPLVLDHLAARLDHERTHSTAPAGYPYETVAGAAREFRAERPDDTAIYFEVEPDRTYGELAADAEALAVSLADMGLVKGDVVSFQLPNWYEAAVLNLACATLGLVINPIVIIYRKHEVEYMLAHASARAFFVADRYRKSEFRPMVDEIRPRLPELEHVVYVRPEGDGDTSFADLVAAGRGRTPPAVEVSANDFKLLLYTSGTTGEPKGVLHTHRSMLWAMSRYLDAWRLGEGDVMVMASPVTHITGFSNALDLPFISAVKSAVMEFWNADNAVAFTERVGGTITMGATPFLTELLAASERAGDDLPTLRYFACGGADVPPELIDKANRHFSRCRAFRVYGSSETPIISMGFVGDGEETLAATTDGRITGYDVRVVDDDGQDVPNGTSGEILAKGPAMMIGYLKPEHHAGAFDVDGFFRTGDLGYRTDDDALVITGRKKDIIIRGGENLSAKEIEDVLHTCPGVAEAAAVSMPHRRLGETVCAYVIPSPGAELVLKDLTDHCTAAGLARQKHPEHLELVEDLPRTASGKVRKDQLRARIREGYPDGPAA